MNIGALRYNGKRPMAFHEDNNLNNYQLEQLLCPRCPKPTSPYYVPLTDIPQLYNNLELLTACLQERTTIC